MREVTTYILSPEEIEAKFKNVKPYDKAEQGIVCGYYKDKKTQELRKEAMGSNYKYTRRSI